MRSQDKIYKQKSHLLGLFECGNLDECLNFINISI